MTPYADRMRDWIATFRASDGDIVTGHNLLESALSEACNDWRGLALLVADTCNDPFLVREAERLLGITRSA